MSFPKSFKLLKIYLAFSIDNALSDIKGVWIASVSIPNKWTFCPVVIVTILNNASCI